MAVMVADYLVLPLFGVKHNYNYNDIFTKTFHLSSGLPFWLGDVV